MVGDRLSLFAKSRTLTVILDGWTDRNSSSHSVTHLLNVGSELLTDSYIYIVKQEQVPPFSTLSLSFVPPHSQSQLLLLQVGLVPASHSFIYPYIGSIDLHKERS